MSEKTLIRTREIMTKQHIELDGLMTVADAIKEMAAAKANVLIVKKRDQDDEYGIVQLSDIAKKVLAKDRSADRVNIYEIMTKPVISVSPDMDVRYCSRLFEQFGLSSVPVIEQGEIIGMVGYTELVLQGLLKLQE